MLVRILEESQPLGPDHEVVLETLDALGTVGTDAAVPALLTMARRRKFFGGRKLRALKDRSVDALARIGTAKSKEALKRGGCAAATDTSEKSRGGEALMDARTRKPKS